MMENVNYHDDSCQHFFFNHVQMFKYFSVGFANGRSGLSLTPTRYSIVFRNDATLILLALLPQCTKAYTFLRDAIQCPLIKCYTIIYFKQKFKGFGLVLEVQKIL